MTDDAIDKVADQTSDKSFGDGFAEEPKTDKAPAVKSEVKVEDKTVPADDQGPAKGSAEVSKPKDETGKETELVVKEEPQTAQERMEAMAKETAPVVSEPVPEKAPVVTAPVIASAPAGQGNWISDLIKSPEVAGTKIGVAGKEMTIAEFAEEYPEAVQAPIAIAKVMFEKALREVEARNVTEMQQIRSELSEMRFWDGVHQAHSDGRKIAASPEFKAWTAKQTPLVGKMLTSENVADATAVLDAYKESLAKDVKKSKDDVAAKHKEARDGLHGESLRSKGSAPEKTTADQDDFDAGFSKTT